MAARAPRESSFDAPSVYVWGENTHGELSVSRRTSQVSASTSLSSLVDAGKGKAKGNVQTRPVRLRPPRGVVLAQVALGMSHTVALSMDNQVLTCGTWISGRLGHDDVRRDLARLRCVRFPDAVLPKHQIVQVACGDHHSVALSAKGELLTWGGTLHGKLGHDAKQALMQMKEKRVQQVDCGRCHTVLCTVQGDVYSFGGGGRHKNHGQLGHNDLEECAKPKRVRFDQGLWAEPSGSCFVVRISCGGFHTVALTQDGRVFTWGKGDFGQLGHGNAQDLRAPRCVDALRPEAVAEAVGEEDRVEDLACGDNHTLVRTAGGRVLSFGFGQLGQLGHGRFRNEHTPRLIEAFASPLADAERLELLDLESSPVRESLALLEESTKTAPTDPLRVTQVAAGWQHSLALTANGAVWAWGCGDKGQLGVGELKSSPTPRHVVELDGMGICQVSAGGSHSLASNMSFRGAAEMMYVLKTMKGVEWSDDDEEEDGWGGVEVIYAASGVGVDCVHRFISVHAGEREAAEERADDYFARVKRHPRGSGTLLAHKNWTEEGVLALLLVIKWEEEEDGVDKPWWCTLFEEVCRGVYRGRPVFRELRP